MGLHSIMDDVYALTEGRGILVALPVRRADAGVGRIKTDQLGGVAHACPALVIKRRRKFRVEAHVRPTAAIEEFEVEQQPRRGKGILQEQRFTPAGMRACTVRVD